MSIPLVERPHHFQGLSPQAEDHLHDLRAQANQELDDWRDFSSRSQAAYQRGDGGQARVLSVESQKHKKEATRLFKAASDFAFLDRNGPDRPSDEVDLHGQTVPFAEQIVIDRIAAEKGRHSSHLRVITGQGIHSANHAAKIKPAIEQLLTQRGFKWHVEEHNAGRIYIDLRGDHDLSYERPPVEHNAHGHGQGHAQGQGQGYQRPPAQQHGGRPDNATEAQDPTEKKITDAINKCVSCCVVM